MIEVALHVKVIAETKRLIKPLLLTHTYTPYTSGGLVSGPLSGDTTISLMYGSSLDKGRFNKNVRVSKLLTT